VLGVEPERELRLARHHPQVARGTVADQVQVQRVEEVPVVVLGIEDLVEVALVAVFVAEQELAFQGDRGGAAQVLGRECFVFIDQAS